jgi:hypothetical protein
MDAVARNDDVKNEDVVVWNVFGLTVSCQGLAEQESSLNGRSSTILELKIGLLCTLPDPSSFQANPDCIGPWKYISCISNLPTSSPAIQL